MRTVALYLGFRKNDFDGVSNEDLSFAYNLIKSMDDGVFTKEYLEHVTERFNSYYPLKRFKSGCMSCVRGQISYSESVLRNEMRKRGLNT